MTTMAVNIAIRKAITRSAEASRSLAELPVAERNQWPRIECSSRDALAAKLDWLLSLEEKGRRSLMLAKADEI